MRRVRHRDAVLFALNYKPSNGGSAFRERDSNFIPLDSFVCTCPNWYSMALITKHIWLLTSYDYLIQALWKSYRAILFCKGPVSSWSSPLNYLDVVLHFIMPGNFIFFSFHEKENVFPKSSSLVYLTSVGLSIILMDLILISSLAFAFSFYALVSYFLASSATWIFQNINMLIKYRIYIKGLSFWTSCVPQLSGLF